MNVSRGSEAFATYKRAVDEVITQLNHQVTVAEGGVSMANMEAWDAGWSGVESALKQAKQARDGYQNVLREDNYGF